MNCALRSLVTRLLVLGRHEGMALLSHSLLRLQRTNDERRWH